MQNYSNPRGRRRLNREDAEILAIGALSFLAAEPERLEGFLALSGLTPETLRTAASTPGFFAAVLDHLCNDESLLLAFAANGGHAPETIVEAQALLSPADEV